MEFVSFFPLVCLSYVIYLCSFFVSSVGLGGLE